MAFDKKTDYQKLINEAVAKGDYQAAAQNEALRNEKINYLNQSGTNTAGHKTTNLYSQYLTGNNTGVNNGVNKGTVSYVNPIVPIAGNPGPGVNTGGAHSQGGVNYAPMTGSSNGIVVNTQAQQAIKDQMNANSMAWYNASDDEKLKLEAMNRELAAQLGSGVTYNDLTGTWTGTADPYQALRPDAFDYNAYLAQNQKPTYSYDAAKPTYSYDATKPTYSFDGTKPTYSYDAEKPTYESQYGAQMDALLDQILNREAFSYDAESDPLYQNYKQQYNREGTRAVQDTLASMASGAGGMNTWAVSAAQQQNDYYASQLQDRIPELYQLAYDMYLNDIDQQVRDFGLLQGMDESQYNRYMDTMDMYYKDKDFAYGQYRDDMGDYQYDQSFAYGQYRDDVGDWESNRDFTYGQYRDDMGDYNTDRNFTYGQYLDNMNMWQDNRDFAYDQSRDQMGDYQYDQSFQYGVGRDQQQDAENKDTTAYNKAMDFLSAGVMPSNEMLQAAGINPSMAQALVQLINPNAMAGTSAGGGGGNPTGTPTPGTKDKGLGDGTDPTIDYDSVYALGFGPQSEAWLENMTARGYLDATVTDDGRIVFSLTEMGKVYKADQERGYNIATGKPTTNTNTNNTTKNPVIQNVQNQIKNDLQPTPAPNAAPNATPPPANMQQVTDMTGTAGVGTALEWMMNQILKKNKN